MAALVHVVIPLLASDLQMEYAKSIIASTSPIKAALYAKTTGVLAVGGVDSLRARYV